MYVMEMKIASGDLMSTLSCVKHYVVCCPCSLPPPQIGSRIAKYCINNFVRLDSYIEAQISLTVSLVAGKDCEHYLACHDANTSSVLVFFKLRLARQPHLGSCVDSSIDRIYSYPIVNPVCYIIDLCV